jgi:NtrC-family two-component system sensor histidine kinase KinB
MPLRRRILLGYGIALVLLAAVLTLAVSSLIPLGEATDAILHENYRSIAAANDMLDLLRQQEALYPRKQENDAQKKIQDLDADFLSALTRAGENITIVKENTVIADIRMLYSVWRGALLAPTERAQKTTGTADNLRARLISLRRLNRDHMYAASDQASAMARRAIWMTVVPGAIGLGLVLLFSFVLSNRLVHPIRAMAEAARMIGAGNLNVRLPEDRHDELGTFAQEFNRMTVDLQRFRDLNIEEVIAARNKSEALLSSIDDGIVLIDRDLRVTEINPAALRLLHRSSGTALGKPTLQLFLPVAEVVDAVQAAFDQGSTPPRVEDQRIFEVPGAKEKQFCQYSVELIRRSEKQPGGAVLVLHDVTRLKEVDRLKSEFVMAASHELRTPLTSIGMSIELLSESIDEKISARDRSLLETAREETTRLRTLVEDLLNLSKIETGRVEMLFEPVRMYPLFERIIAIFAPQCAEKGVQLLCDELPDLLPVHADASKIAWVLTNLVSNALRYVPSGGKIQLIARAFGGAVHVSVKDDGPGIPQEYQSTIFERFRQVPGRLSVGGSGLGLAISKEIVKAHGGTIWVDSASGAGSTFTFTLPTTSKE